MPPQEFPKHERVRWAGFYLVPILFGTLLVLPFTSIAYSVSDPNPLQSDLYLGRHSFSGLVDSSGWLLSHTTDGPKPAHMFYPPSQVHSFSQMVDIFEMGYPELGGHLLGIGYYSIRNDPFNSDAEIFTFRHWVAISIGIIITFLLVLWFRRQRHSKSNETMPA